MKKNLERITSIAAAIILLQTLYFKFTGAPESVYIFEQLGMEHYGRIGTGIIELIISILLLRRKTSMYGGIMGLAVMSGAILSHFMILGIVVQGDGGILFGMAILVFVLLLITVILQKEKLVMVVNKIKEKK